MLPQNKPDRIRILFDDHRLVANAGLLLPATLARHLGLLRSRVPGSGVRGRGSGEREDHRVILSGQTRSSRKGGQRWSRKEWTCWSYCTRREWTVTWTFYGRH